MKTGRHSCGACAKQPKCTCPPGPKGDRGAVGPPGPQPAPKAGDVLAGGLLLVTEDGTPAVTGAFGVTGCATGAPAPGVRSWVLTMDPSLVTPLGLSFGQQVASYAIPFFAARMRYLSSGPIVVEFFLVDAAGTPQDPAALYAVNPGDNIVQFEVFRAGTDTFVGTP